MCPAMRKKFFRFPFAFFVIPVLFLQLSCDSGSSAGGGGGTAGPAQCTVLSISPGSSTFYAGHTCALTYKIRADAYAENVIVSFYLVNKQEADAAAGDVQIQNFALLCHDTIDVIEEGAVISRLLSARVPESLAAGEYYIRAYVDEYFYQPDPAPVNKVADDTVIVDNTRISSTNLKVLDFSLEDNTIILDPQQDLRNYLNVNTTRLIANLGSLLDDPNEALTDLTSDAEIKGSATIVCDGPLPGSVPIQVKCQVNIGGTWYDLESWDNVVQLYRQSVAASILTDSDLTYDFDENYHRVTVDVHVNVQDTVMTSIIQDIINRAGSELPNSFGIRLVVDPDDLIPELDETDNTYEVSVVMYSLAQPVTASNDKVYERHWSKWVGKKKKFKAGVKYTGKYALYNNSTKRGVYAKTELEAPIYVLGHRRTMIYAYNRTASYIARPVYTGYKYELTFFLNTLVSRELWGDHIPLATREYTWNKEKTIGKFKFTVGIIPFKVDVGVAGSAGYELSFGVLDDGLFIENTIPSFNFEVIADGGPSIGVASAGITASLTLADEKVESTANLTFDYDAGSDTMLGGNLDILVKNDLEAISGKFGLYVTYKWFWKEKKSRLWIYKTNSLYDSRKTLYRKSEAFTF